MYFIMCPDFLKMSISKLNQTKWLFSSVPCRNIVGFCITTRQIVLPHWNKIVYVTCHQSASQCIQTISSSLAFGCSCCSDGRRRLALTARLHIQLLSSFSRALLPSELWSAVRSVLYEASVTFPNSQCHSQRSACLLLPANSSGWLDKSSRNGGGDRFGNRRMEITLVVLQLLLGNRERWSERESVRREREPLLEEFRQKKRKGCAEKRRDALLRIIRQEEWGRYRHEGVRGRRVGWGKIMPCICKHMHCPDTFKCLEHTFRELFK